jgi:hypothetical protein
VRLRYKEAKKEEVTKMPSQETAPSDGDLHNDNLRKILITTPEGHTGFTIAELLLTDPTFSSAINPLGKEGRGGVSLLTFSPNHANCKLLNSDYGTPVLTYQPDHVADLTATIQASGCDTLLLIPPAHHPDKLDIAIEVLEAVKRSSSGGKGGNGGGVKNMLLISMAGCDLAERGVQDELRNFVDLEAEFWRCKSSSPASDVEKGEPTGLGEGSLCVLR